MNEDVVLIVIHVFPEGYGDIIWHNHIFFFYSNICSLALMRRTLQGIVDKYSTGGEEGKKKNKMKERRKKKMRRKR